MEIFKELDGHLEQQTVLADASLEASVHLQQLVHDLVLLTLSVTFQGQHLRCLQVLLNLLLSFLQKVIHSQGHSLKYELVSGFLDIYF